MQRHRMQIQIRLLKGYEFHMFLVNPIECKDRSASSWLEKDVFLISSFL